MTTDFGTEAGLADVQNINLSEMFPWAGLAVDFEGADADMPLSDMRAMGPGFEMRAGSLILTKLFSLALQVPEALHVLHQSVKELTSAFSAKYAEWFFPGLQAVTAVFGKAHNRERFIAEKLRSTEARNLETSVRQLS